MVKIYISHMIFLSKYSEISINTTTLTRNKNKFNFKHQTVQVENLTIQVWIPDS